MKQYKNKQVLIGSGRFSAVQNGSAGLHKYIRKYMYFILWKWRKTVRISLEKILSTSIKTVSDTVHGSPIVSVKPLSSQAMYAFFYGFDEKVDT